MLICSECGKLIEDCELEYYTEIHGEVLPKDCSCGGTFVEARRCECCGEYYEEEEMIGGVCKKCDCDEEQEQRG